MEHVGACNHLSEHPDLEILWTLDAHLVTADAYAKCAHCDAHYLVDLPGYGYAQRSKAERRSWGPLIESFLSQRPGLRAVVLIVDVRRGPEDDDAQLLEYLQSIDRRAIVVATKLDKVPRSKQKLALKAISDALGGMRVHGFSATKGDGRDKLWRSLLRAAHLGT